MAINNATSGTITLNDVTVALSGSTADVKAALAGTFAVAYSGNVVINDANLANVAAADINTIAGATSGTVTVTNNINITGNSDVIAAAVADVDTFSGTPTATLGDAHTLAELKAINNAIDGTITLNDVTVALNGSSADIAAALAGTFAAGYTGTATLTSNHSLAELVAINNGTSGNITLNSSALALVGSTSDVKAALAGNVGDTYTGNIVLNDANTRHSSSRY